MLRLLLLLPLLAAMPQQESLPSHQAVGIAPGDAAPSYTAAGDLKLPVAYREWVFLTSGVDMSYSPNQAAAGHSMFDNVFVNPSAYQSFKANGTWPDKTTLVLEIRGAEGPSSINQHGHSQAEQVMGVEVHVKDATLPGGWGFFEFDGDQPAKLVKRPASCYQCHEEHAAVDTTFVQFYPTLLPVAKTRATLSPAYLKKIAEPAK